jgi:8-oxo-dGTP pyrophosphatase MutT (NUDIX family)
MNENLLKRIIKMIPEEQGLMNSSEYPRSSVLASFFVKDRQLHFIFQKRNSSIRQGGEICFPGGRFDKEKDKNMLETSVRETMEEMGIERDKILVLGQIDTLVSPMGAIVHCFLGELKIQKLSELKINKDEVERIFSVPLSWFINNPPSEYDVHMEFKPRYTDEKGKEVILLPVEELGLPDRYRKPWGNKNHKIYAYRTNGETIWGITAQMVKYIADLLKNII